MRFGLMTNEKRSWSKIGQRTKLPNQLEYSNRYMYSEIVFILLDLVTLILNQQIYF